MLLPSHYLLPENDRHIPILICGDWGCWPLEARVIVESDQVIWRDFQQSFRADRYPSPWSYEGLGPFEFDRKLYEAELGKLLRDESYQKFLWHWTDILRGDRIKEIQEKVVAWAKQQENVQAVGLVGSWALWQANFNSDVDLVLLVSNPTEFRHNANWPRWSTVWIGPAKTTSDHLHPARESKLWHS